MIDETVNNKDFQKSDIKMETYESNKKSYILKKMKMGVLLS